MHTVWEVFCGSASIPEPMLVPIINETAPNTVPGISGVLPSGSPPDLPPLSFAIVRLRRAPAADDGSARSRRRPPPRPAWGDRHRATGCRQIAATGAEMRRPTHVPGSACRLPPAVDGG